MFSHSSNTQINGGIFTHTTYPPHALPRAGFERLLQETTPGALHNSGERFDPPKCHPRTRVSVMQTLLDWTTGKLDDDKLIMWLYGPAGAGKSAITQTLAEQCAKEGLLLASFFFSRMFSSRSTARSLIATIAYQVALAIPATKALIERAIDTNPMIFDQSFETQLSQLLFQPLRQLSLAGPLTKDLPILVIIDGLDECHDPRVQCNILDAISSLATLRAQCAISLRVLIASRPERHLKTTFSTPNMQPILGCLALDSNYNPDSDILRFLTDSFEDIKNFHPLGSIIPASWPERHVLDALVAKSSGQFIYAVIAVKYVSSHRHRPMERLGIILGIVPASHERDLPFGELNALYHHILNSVEDIEKTMQSLGALLLLNDLPQQSTFLTSRFIQRTEDIDTFFFWAKGDARLHLDPVRSLVDYDYTGFITVLHASLPDFLFDRTRSRQFFIDRNISLTEHVCLGLKHIREYESLFTSSYIQSLLSIVPACMLQISKVSPRLRQELSTFEMPWMRHHQKKISSMMWQVSSGFFSALDRLGLEQLRYEHLRSFDEVLLSNLHRYPDPLVTHLITTLVVTSNLALHHDTADKLKDILGLPSSLLEFDARCGLDLACSLHHPRVQRQYMWSFFTEEKRSRMHYASSSKFLATALHCLRFLSEGNLSNESQRTVIFALKLLPMYLVRSEISVKVVRVLTECETLTKWPLNDDASVEGATVARKAISSYLSALKLKLQEGAEDEKNQ